MLTAVLTLWDHLSGCPSGEADQSLARIRAPISPPPVRHAGLVQSSSIIEVTRLSKREIQFRKVGLTAPFVQGNKSAMGLGRVKTPAPAARVECWAWRAKSGGRRGQPWRLFHHAGRHSHRGSPCPRPEARTRPARSLTGRLDSRQGISGVLQGIASRVSRSFLHRGGGQGLILSCSSENQRRQAVFPTSYISRRGSHAQFRPPFDAPISRLGRDL